MDDRSYSVFLQSVVEIKDTLGSVDPAILSETSSKAQVTGAKRVITAFSATATAKTSSLFAVDS
jgi:hypothetical protein